jgi:hypothetical protein
LGLQGVEDFSKLYDLLNRKGLNKVMTQGPFHHHLDEALHHIATAHLREDWCQIAGVENLAELREKSAEELKQLSEKIVQERACSEALDAQDKKPDNEKDEELCQIIMWNQDILYYLILDQAMKEGDVGLMEQLLPQLLYRFVGGGNSKCAIEVLELMEGLYVEWPEEIS